MSKEYRLSDLKPGQEAQVKEIHVKGSLGQRLLDLGVVPGTTIKCLSKSPLGNPLAYQIRGSVVAIRKETGRAVFLEKNKGSEILVALAGNPNVGKSTVFNGLTKQHQHTGNWIGKTVASAKGSFKTRKHTYQLVDIPGTYSLGAQSTEEEIARNYICFGETDMVVVVCDATCLERNLNLVLQIMEVKKQVILCVNLMDEAKRKNIQIDIAQLQELLGIPVAGVTANRRGGLQKLVELLEQVAEEEQVPNPKRVVYKTAIEDALTVFSDSRWLGLSLLTEDTSFLQAAKEQLGEAVWEKEDFKHRILQIKENLRQQGLGPGEIIEQVAEARIHTAEEICKKTVHCKQADYNHWDRRIDKVFTSRWLGYPLMLVLLALVFWITIVGANYPSQLLSTALFRVQDWLTEVFHFFQAPEWLHGILVLGMYRVLAWVVAVMLPPMAIFFPLFTLLEDAGYLPRIAFNLDLPFARCKACGKQALTMAMGFGCNAVGVMGCRIIDSPRERLIAIITNSFVPCNGRFPTLILLISLFFVGSTGGVVATIKSALLLTLLILLGIFMTFFVSRMLSATILKGVSSGVTLELPPYRKPQVGKVLVRSVLDRTLFVLRRAVVAAAPAGMLIWFLANTAVEGEMLLAHCANFLEPLGRTMGVDGVILLAFFLGLPANEIVMPIVLMAYMAQGQMLEPGEITNLKELLIQNGWTPVTAMCTMVFSLLHWPCATTLLTIKKEAGGWRWVFLSMIIPTVLGIGICLLISGISRLI